MTPGPTHHTQRPGPWTLVLFACVLVLAQALLVGHQVGHLAHGDETAACEICLIGGGLGAFKGKVWRVGLMGYTSNRENVTLLLGALRAILGR